MGRFFFRIKCGFLPGFILMVFNLSCTEEVAFNPTSDLSDIVVVEASLTDKVEKQSISLSHAFNFKNGVPEPLSNASVHILDDLGNSMEFIETNLGTYTSVQELRLRHDRKYQLVINIEKGIEISSNEESPPFGNRISVVDVLKSSKDLDGDGVSIVVSASASGNEEGYFRFEYEEIYQIIAPEYNGVTWDEVDYDYFMDDDDGWEVTIKQVEEESRVCYVENQSNDVTLESTEKFNDNELNAFEVRFLRKDNYIISQRYSILVKQYQLTKDNYNFYNTLDKFSDIENIFSNVQTGAIENNLISNDPNQVVLGYFGISSYSEKRVFFNKKDLFPEDSLPVFPINCEGFGKPALYPEGFHVTFVNGELVIDGASDSPLIDAIQAGLIGYYAHNPDYEAGSTEEDPERAPFFVKPLACSDCRALGSNKKPEFWID